MPISPELVSLLRQAQYNPSACRGYDHFSGGFHWSDEFPEGLWEIVLCLQDWSHRMLMAHRAAITLGGDDSRFITTWQQVERDAPDRPGLRLERRDPGLSAQLIAKREEVDAGLEALDQKIRSSPRRP